MANVRRTVGIAALVIVGLLVFGGGWLTGRLGIGSVVNPASLTDVERQFAERMRGVTMIGSFTVVGRENRKPEPDRYDIASVEKVGEDLWRFNASMDCCGVKGNDVADRRADAIRRRHANHHDDGHEPAGHRHFHRAGVFLRRLVRRNLATRSGRRPHVRTH